MDISNLFTSTQQEILFANGRGDNWRKNHVPVVFLEARRLGYSFLITELSERTPHYAFGLCDYDTDIRIDLIDLKELSERIEARGCILKPDPSFKPKYNLAVYAKAIMSNKTVFFADKLGKEFERVCQRFNKGSNCDPNRNILELHRKYDWISPVF